MADDKKTYPLVNRKGWFALRKQFQKTVPQQVSLTYLASILGIDEQSARANVLGGLKLAGLIDGDNKPTQLAYRWRLDEEYAQVCEEIRQAVYPDELRAIAPDSTTPKERIVNWFAGKQGVGTSAAGKYAAFYLLLCEADPTKEKEGTRTRAATPPKTPRTRAKQPPVDKNPSPPARPAEDTVPVETPAPTVVEHSDSKKARPSLHIDIQIHISPESSADQIEQIFASMAKHLKEI